MSDTGNIKAGKTGPETGNVEPEKKFFTPENILNGFFVLLGLAVLSIIIQYFTATQATFQDLKDQVTAQNAKMDLLIQEYGKK